MVTRRPSLVCLCVLLLLGCSLQRSTRVQMASAPVSDIMKKVQSVLDMVKNSNKYLDCSLYTPDGEEFRQKCPVSTIQCFAVEMNVLVEELDIPRRLYTSKHLVKLSKKCHFNQTDSQCAPCELSEEKNAREFLERVLSTLQEIKSTPRRTSRETC